MNDAFMAEIHLDLMNITADWYVGNDISKYYPIMCKRIMELNEWINTIPTESRDAEPFHILVEVCYQFYVFRDQACLK
ncbi:hypothetical protein [Mucilaginibacter sp.]|jgi:hypothetical protein|uniref:hypothetical protein n=1 Tax=Mucilaginibacter sp. TaxID=1882438 RepID=UPI002609A070|nr:hypothetical protein [Mucilaginibacter sp.]MDB4918312.1 hypothetical protein [Mucilaginibacter sp.]